MPTQVKSEDEATYGNPKPAASADDNVILKALMILETRIKTKGAPLLNPQDTRNYLRIELAGLKDERFCALFLDTRYRVIEFRTLFHGTIDGASVYPRVVARIALEVNAKAVIFAHNHPSGDSEPSEADRRITDKLKDALNLFEIQVIDHVIVGDGELTSFADRGLL